jgi:transposase InsO family protein
VSSEPVCPANPWGTLEAKLTNNISKEITNKALNYLDEVVLDLCGPITPSTLTGYRYILFILDSATRFLSYRLLKNKSDELEAFKDFKLEAENQCSSKIKDIKSDLGGEFNNNNFTFFSKKEGIIQQFSSSRTPKENGLIERVNRTIIESTRTLLFTSRVPLYLWGEAINTAVYLYNIVPHSAIQGRIPYNLVYKNTKINYNVFPMRVGYLSESATFPYQHACAATTRNILTTERAQDLY